MAWAALPWQVCILLFASHKQGSYLAHEILLFEAALVTAVLMAGAWLAARLPWQVIQKAFPAAAAVALAGYLACDTSVLSGAVIRAEARVHEGDVARAASRLILGEGASVASRLGAWYTSGAEFWHDTFMDLFQLPKSYDPAAYFATFDALADYPHRSDDKLKGDETLSSWYAGGFLKLRGFFFGESGPDLQILYFSLNRTAQVVGYGSSRHKLYRFEEYSDGDYLVTSSICSGRSFDAADSDLRVSGTLHGVLLLPGGGVLATIVTPRNSPFPVPWLATCKPVTTIRGRLLIADKNALIAGLRHEDKPIHVLQRLEHVPGFVGMPIPPVLLPPTNTVRLERVLDFAKIKVTTSEAAIAHIPHVRLSTLPGPGAFSALIPIAQGASLAVPCWIQLRLQVDSGRIGFLVLDEKFAILAAAKATLLKMSQPADVALRMDGLAKASYVVIFNDDWSGASQVNVFDATVLVTRDDWTRNMEALAKLR
jgi:hypothetical protein